MKTLNQLLIVSILLLVLTGCRQPLQEPALGSLSVTVGVDEGARTLRPDFATAIDHYLVSGIGPEEATFGPTSSAGSTLTVGGLAIGTWAVTVEGIDGDGEVVARGGGSVPVEGSGSELSIVVSFLQEGAGTARLDISWPGDVGIDAVLVSLDGGEETDIHPGAGATSVTYNPPLDSGYYFVMIRFVAGSDLRATLGEAIHIYDNLETTATFALTPQDLTVPPAPTGFSAVNDGMAVDLSWNAEAIFTETGFRLERDTDSGFPSPTVVDTLTINTSAYEDTTIAQATDYHYRLCAVNTYGDSPWATTSITTLSVAPAAPTLTHGEPGSDELIAEWPAVPGATSYSVRYHTADDSAAATQLTTDDSATDTTATIGELSYGSTYYVWVKAHNAGGASDFSPAATVAFTFFGADPYFSFQTVVSAGTPGEFEMGSNDGGADEQPVHSVTLTRAYEVGTYEITNDQYAAVMNEALERGWVTASATTVQNVEGNTQELLDVDSGYCRIDYDGSSLVASPGYGDHPVTAVTWYGGVAFAYYLNAIEAGDQTYDMNDWSPDYTNAGYRLPSEAEWEYAARGGASSEGYVCAGSDSAGDVAWFADNSGSTTHPVGTKTSNEVGTCDMSGNVWEWTDDPYESTSYSTSTPTDPGGTAAVSLRAVRGGSYGSSGAFVRVALREAAHASSDTFNAAPMGFRLVRQTVSAYPLTYDANGVTTGAAPPVGYHAEADVVLAGNVESMERTGFSFAGWNTQGDGNGTHYDAGATFPMPAEATTIYAEWTLLGDDPLFTFQEVLAPGSTATFAMGQPNPDVHGASADEQPVHTVTLTRPYEMSTHEITWTQYAAVLDVALDEGWATATEAGVCNAEGALELLLDTTDTTFGHIEYTDGELVVDAGWENHPVTTVTWYGAAALATYCNRMTGRPDAYDLSTWEVDPGAVGYRLPTEAEWEYAARGGAQSQGYTYAGSNVIDDVAWYGHIVAAPQTVGQKAPNEIGLYDMSGNCWEWNHDWYAIDAYGTSMASDPSGPVTAAERALRGGSFYHAAEYSRVHERNANTPGHDGWYYYTVRLVRQTAPAYALTYEANGATAGTAPPAGYHAATDVVLSANIGSLERTGYAFVGWNTAPDGNGTHYDLGDTYAMPPADTTLYAEWATEAWSLSYDGNGNTGGSAPATTSHEPGATVPVASGGGLTMTGHRFETWNTQADGLGVDYAEGALFPMPAENVTLFAQWVVDSYSLYYLGNQHTGGSPPDATEHSFGAIVSIAGPGTLVKTGHTFAGWNTQGDGLGTSYSEGDAFAMPGENAYLYAKWDINVYSVSYDGNGNTGGSPPEGTQHAYATTVTTAGRESLTKNEYTFGGWNTQSDGLGTHYGAAAEFEMPLGDVVLFAEWNVNAYNIGDPGQAGGIVFYRKASYTDGWRFLEVAPNNLSGLWGGLGTAIGGTSSAVGAGSANTDAIVAVHGTGANSVAAICYHYELDGYDDWFLPSLNEVIQIYNQRSVIEGLTMGTSYWSSTEHATLPSERAFKYYFHNTLASSGTDTKNLILLFRPVRAF